MAIRRSLSHPSLVLFACLFASQSGLLVLSPILVDVAREFGVSTATAGQLRSISGATGGMTALVIATAARRPGLRELLSLGAALVALGSGLSAVAPSFTVLAAAQAVLGVGIGLLVAVGIAAAGEWPTPSRRPHVLAWAIAGMPAAWIVGMPVVGAVANYGWRAAWLAVPAVAGLIALALVRLRPGDARSRCSGGSVALWRRPDVARFAGGELLANAAWASVLTYSGALLLESYDLASRRRARPRPHGGGDGARNVHRAPPRRARHARTARRAHGLPGPAVLALGAVRPGVGVTLALLAVMAFVNGRRSMVASALGIDAAPEQVLELWEDVLTAEPPGLALPAVLDWAAELAGMTADADEIDASALAGILGVGESADAKAVAARLGVTRTTRRPRPWRCFERDGVLDAAGDGVFRPARSR